LHWKINNNISKSDFCLNKPALSTKFFFTLKRHFTGILVPFLSLIVDKQHLFLIFNPIFTIFFILINAQDNSIIFYTRLVKIFISYKFKL